MHVSHMMLAVFAKKSGLARGCVILSMVSGEIFIDATIKPAIKYAKASCRTLDQVQGKLF
jgi:hypothetical protein